MGNIKRILLFNEKKVMVLIFFVALILRLVAVITLPNEYQTPGADAAQYDILAVNLLAGKGYTMDLDTGRPTSFWVPLYPVFLAFIYLIFGIKNYFAVRCIQSIISALLCIIIFHIGKITFNRKIGLLAAVILVFYQPYIFHSFYGGPVFLLSENLFIFLLALTVLFLIRDFLVRPCLRNSVIAGILVGFIILTRPVFALFPLLLFGLMKHKNKYSFFAELKGRLSLFIIIALVILPWTARNYIVHKTFVPLSTEAGFALFSANNPASSGGGHTNPEELLPPEQRNRLKKMSEVQKSKALWELGKDYLIKNYRQIPKLWLKKLMVLWDVFVTDYSGISVKRKYDIWYAIILMFGLVGIVKTLRSKFNINTLLLISLFTYFSVITMIFAGDPRLRYPTEQFLIIFASLGIFTIYEKFKNKFLSYLIVGFVVGINFLIYIYSELILSWTRYLLNIMHLT